MKYRIPKEEIYRYYGTTNCHYTEEEVQKAFDDANEYLKRHDVPEEVDDDKD